MAIRIISGANIETLADEFINDLLKTENFKRQSSKNSFLTGDNVIVCEERGLQEYLKKKCVDKHGIWAFSFKPLAGLLMQIAYNLQEKKEDENRNFFAKHNLLWAIYNMLKGEEKTFAFACELAALFANYQIYRPKMIEAWNKNLAFDGKEAAGVKTDANFRENEKIQREYWRKLKESSLNEQDISQLYKTVEEKRGKIAAKNIFVFAPLSIAPVHLKTLRILAENGSSVNLYLRLISNEYISESKSDKAIAYLRKKSWENKIADEKKLYWDLGNRLVANLGRSAQVLYEQINWDNLNFCNEERRPSVTLLQKIQEDIFNDENACNSFEMKEDDKSVSINGCFSPLREIEVLRDYIIDSFAEDKSLKSEDIAVVSANIGNYADAINSVFGKDKIPYKISDCDAKKEDKTAQLFNLLFSQIGSEYEAPDVLALFEYSKFAQNKPLSANDRDALEKWLRENAVRRGIKSEEKLPNYSFESGFEQLAAGFFMISESGFSEKDEYCYPDIEGGSAQILGDFANFTAALKKLDEACFENACEKEKTVSEWDGVLRDNLQAFFGADAVDYREDAESPYQRIMNKWDELKEEMRIGFGLNASKIPLSFSVLKSALLKKTDESAISSYSLSANISFSNIRTVRGVPRKIICVIGMNAKEFPRRPINKEISLTAPKYRLDGDPDLANEDRLVFLETVLSAKEKLFISWVGQSEKTAQELEPSSAVKIFSDNLQKQYAIKKEDFIIKHPLQPFSKKYFDKSDKALKTYDRRWETPQKRRQKSVWEWEVAVSLQDGEAQEKSCGLYEILSDAPDYFFTKTCNMRLPQTLEILENEEPFTVESELEKWKIRKAFLDGESEDKKRIRKLRGESASGIFADKLIQSIESDVAELKEAAKNEAMVFPGSDNGKYRLKHWLHHLYLNLQEKQTTKMFLKNATVELSGIEREKAQEILGGLQDLADGLKTKLLPVFLSAAWEYLLGKGIEAAWEKAGDFSPYSEIIFGGARSFEELKIEKDFIRCSKKLFDGYGECEVKNDAV